MTLERLKADPRVLVRQDGPPDPNGRCILYWMQRAQRGRDNPALDVAVDAANLLGLPVVAFLGLVPDYPNANWRHYHFLAEGLADLQEDLADRNIGFVFRRHPGESLLQFAAEAGPALIVGDENPLRRPESWRKKIAAEARVPVWTVDADVIVPTRLLLKEQFAARTIRPLIHLHLAQFLVAGHEPKAHHSWKGRAALRGVEELEGLGIDRSVSPVNGFRGGSAEGLARLKNFVRHRLHGYHVQRNRPELDGTSGLSPYLHFGQLGPRQVALAVKTSDAPSFDKAAFIEQLIVRRELAVNFVHYNANYDRLDGCEPWAKETLRRHRGDPRPVRVSARQLEAAESPDPLWNAAQRQMVTDGWMHGYLRMYWAKKILEWSDTPEEAFARAVELNDRYQLDGRDPNGYTGIAWAIGGKHDRAWGPERPVYGKVRYMSYASTSRKFDSRTYVESHHQEEAHE
jgi:deoxyribodipyrimidine photo-lyase